MEWSGLHSSQYHNLCLKFLRLENLASDEVLGSLLSRLSPQHVLNEKLSGLSQMLGKLGDKLSYQYSYLVTAAHERTTCDIQEAHVLGHLLPAIEFGRFNIPVDLHVPLSWSHILTECDHVHVHFTQFCRVTVNSVHEEQPPANLPRRASMICSSFSPTPSMMLVLVTRTPSSFARSSTLRLCLKVAWRSRTNGVRASAVSMLCA